MGHAFCCVRGALSLALPFVLVVFGAGASAQDGGDGYDVGTDTRFEDGGHWYAVVSAGGASLDAQTTTTLSDGSELVTDYDTDLGGSWRLAVGYDYGALMLEGELSGSQNGLNRVFDMVDGEPVFVPNSEAVGDDSPRLELTSLMVNAWLQPLQGTAMEGVYIGGGIGVAESNFSYRRDDATYYERENNLDRVTLDEETGAIWQLGAGYRHVFPEGVLVGFGYRYVETSSGGGTDREMERDDVFVEVGVMF